ncbi:MAG: YciI family protein [Actinomycetota bacterium]
MRFVISVIDSQTRSPHSPEEIAAIDAINEEMLASGYRVFAGGLDAPSKAVVFDNRGGAKQHNEGSFHEGNEFFSGLWIIDVPNREIAEELAAKGSLACNRKVELRPLLG